MSAQLNEKETLKRLHDLYRDAPWIGHVVANSVLDIARSGQKIGITKDDITEDLLASIDSVNDLEELAAAGGIGPNRKFPKKRRI
jgi:hypothetical protein